ncbi:hypothetical protein GCM10011575_40280 [Microlunatus endophyticus]|uniref:Phage shock protein PspC N-terminal domain-containing protein n=1 Tax=Microlunatus endophyticus TaxID=1716077 RepID=A0A917SG20_9ACTN|nr:PspC domain-containing protein [Microlunatus endophyticus]GGL77940.1 hypothetical protein GCM10011575_40280 [Microlunatus endophyticus]
MSSIWTVRRSATDHKVSGLAGGLAADWNVDPMLVRVGFAVLALGGGVGIVLYAAGWLMVPLEDKDKSQLEEWVPQTAGWSREVKIGIVVVACIIGAVALSWLVPFSFTAALVVAAIWYFGYYRNRDQHRAERDQPQQQQLRFAEFPGEPTAFTEAARAWQQRIADYQQAQLREQSVRQQTTREPSVRHQPSSWGTFAYAEPRAGAATAAPDRDFDHEAFLADPDPVGLYSEPAPDSAIDRLTTERRLRRRAARRLGLMSVIVLGLTMTGLGVLSVLGLPITASVYLSAALLVFGITLLIGARIGRPRGLAFATVVVAVAMVLTLIGQNNTSFAGDIGVQQRTYGSLKQLPAADHLRTGQLTVDLSTLRPDRSVTYSASVDKGRLVVDLPPDVTTALTARVDNGMLKTGNDQQSIRTGPDLVLTEPAPAGSKGPVFTVRLSVGDGELEVRR